jgi:hypothetical protein
MAGGYVARSQPLVSDDPEGPALGHAQNVSDVEQTDARVRMTVIGDPQGATFTASELVPENHGLATAGFTNHDHRTRDEPS